MPEADRQDLFPLIKDIGNVLLVHRTEIEHNLDTDANPIEFLSVFLYFFVSVCLCVCPRTPPKIQDVVT